jgi:hypothetical protein
MELPAGSGGFGCPPVWHRAGRSVVIPVLVRAPHAFAHGSVGLP